MTTLRKHLSELQAIATDMQAALDRGETPAVFDANILEFHAQALAVGVRNAFVASLVGQERTPEEDRAAQRYIETGRDAAGITSVLDDTASAGNSDRDHRPEHAA